ncbi:MAG: glycosyltransferase family 2 protein, partial [Candidatus Omnitrophica bacterium]|nr:glycosyltransferase family 2 protein [Candidatus Omnitrophota bacterium]
MINLSVVILTKNEEKDIGDCLESVAGWANEIVIMDDESTDKTIDIASQYTDKIIVRKMEIEGRHRNFAYSKAKNLWILSLDADERVTPELRKEIEEALKANPRENGFT